MDAAFQRVIYNQTMKNIHWPVLIAAFLLIACQPSVKQTITIIDGETIFTLQSNLRTPLEILAEAEISFAPEDRLFLNGFPARPDSPITNYPITLQIRRAVPITISATLGDQTIQTSAFTVGEALRDAGFDIHFSDSISSPLQSPISGLQIPVTLFESQPLTITANGKSITTTSSAPTVAEALAEAGIPLLGNDYSIPAGNEALPLDGQIKVARVSESVVLAQKPIPFTNELIASAEVPLDQTQVLQPGENGLTMQRIRIRYDDGVEISRITEAETVVRPPQNRVLGYGTKVEIKTAVVDGVSIEYWRAVQLYITSYSPCRSGGDRCYNGTSSGAKVQKGVAGMRYSWYLVMGGQQLYIPGYGYATVADVCGGCVGKPWIDVAYSDNDYVPWSSWVTVYFLTPVPSNILYTLE